MYGNNFQSQPPTDFNVKIYKGDNSISLATTDSSLLSFAKMPKVNETLMVANIKQFLSYHLIRIISDSFNYLDYNVYNLVNNYVNGLNLIHFIKEDKGNEALRFNILAEIYKISEVLLFYQKPLITDIESIKEEIAALVDKIFKSI